MLGHVARRSNQNHSTVHTQLCVTLWFDPLIGNAPQNTQVTVCECRADWAKFQPGHRRVNGVSWPSGLAYRTQVLVLAAECGFESRP